ncbi:relaxase/mobilization nuclease domain-containing protein [Sulfitobacter sp. SH24]|uniref:relaxase/mobilization nuclease domain-containing protein n=1 Tax=Sulfitobacter sp. SH24 TaxID=3421173 RepID=UPI003F506A99
MAIAKISRPRGPGPTVRYIVGPVDHAGRERGQVAVIGSTIGKRPDTAIKFLGEVAKLRPRLRRHLYHVSISVPPNDRELSRSGWAAIGRAWCEGMGIENYMIVLHDAHIHIIGSRIRLDGTAVSDTFDYRRSELLLRTIETQFGLAPTRSSHLVDRARGVPHQRARTLKEVHAVRRDGRSHKDFIRQSIDDALAEEIDAAQLRTVLAEAGIEMMLEQAADGAGYVLFGFQGRSYGARSLGQGYSLTNLLVRGLQLSAPQNARAQLPTPPWALDEGVSRKKPQGAGHHEDALRRLRGFGREAHQVIDRYRARDGAQHPSPGSDPSGAGPEPEEKPPDVS